MKVSFFRVIAKLNKIILPSFKDKDLTKLTNLEKLIVGWRIWVTKNALGN